MSFIKEKVKENRLTLPKEFLEHDEDDEIVVNYPQTQKDSVSMTYFIGNVVADCVHCSRKIVYFIEYLF